jgi:nitronate monooxygenase
MHRFSGLRLVEAARDAGIIGAFPSSNPRSVEELDAWLTRLDAAAAQPGPGGLRPPPYCVNLIMRQPRLEEDLSRIRRHRVEMVITSVGSPRPIVESMHETGAVVFADVSTIAQAEKCVAMGVDGLVLLSAGAGGQTGWLNPFSFVRGVREVFDGPLLLSGGMSDGVALRAARCLGCDLGYIGSHVLATVESEASPEYREALVELSADDVVLTNAFSGLPTSILRSSIVRAGLDPGKLDEQVTPSTASEIYGAKSDGSSPKRWTDIWSAGHSVSGINRVGTMRELVDRFAEEYAAASHQRV